MLLDVNCLLAIAWPNHQHHGLVSDWFQTQARKTWHTCAVTELGFVRLSSNPAFTTEHVTPPEAIALLESLKSIGNNVQIDSPSPCMLEAMKSPRVQGHRQITDCYLLALAHLHGLQLASLDRRLSTLSHADTHLHSLG